MISTFRAKPPFSLKLRQHTRHVHNQQFGATQFAVVLYARTGAQGSSRVLLAVLQIRRAIDAPAYPYRMQCLAIWPYL